MIEALTDYLIKRRLKKILKKCKKLKYVNNRFNRNKELFSGFQ